MKAMKQVVPGADLPVSYLSNSRGLDVEGQRSGEDEIRLLGLPIPGYKTQSGDFIVRWELEFEERADVLQGTEKSKSILALLLDSHLGNGEPVQPVTSTADLIASDIVVRDVKFGVRESDLAAFIRDGNLWQTVRSLNGCMYPVALSASCPNLPEDMAPNSFSRVLMSANGMIDETGEASAYFVCCVGGKYLIDGFPGEFDTENAAIAELGKRLYGENKGKWSAWKDIAGRGPEEPLATGMFAPVACPVCEGNLNKYKVPLAFGRSEKYVDRMWCPKCQKKFVVENGVAGDPELKFINTAVLFGLNEDVARLLWDTFKGDK